jgi:hypothetical protein
VCVDQVSASREGWCRVSVGPQQQHNGLAADGERKADATDLLVAGGMLKQPLAGEPTGERYHVWTPSEIWAPIDPPTYAIGSLSQGDIGMVNAHGSSLKSWLAVDAVIAKAAGAKWLERFPCKPAPATYLDNEMGPDECRRRKQRVALAKGLRGPVAGVSLVSMPPFDLTDADGIGEIRKLAKGQALIVIDSLSAFSPGVDENDARFADPLKRCKEIGVATKCAFLFLHHSRKSRGDDEDQRERPRGTSALFAACDVVFQLSRHGAGFLVTQTKSRKGKAVDAFVLQVQDVDGVDATRVCGTDVDDVADSVEAAANAFGRAKRAILLLLANHHDVASGNELAKRLKGIGRVPVLGALKEHIKGGTVVEYKGALRLASEVSGA